MIDMQDDHDHVSVSNSDGEYVVDASKPLANFKVNLRRSSVKKRRTAEEVILTLETILPHRQAPYRGPVPKLIGLLEYDCGAEIEELFY